MDATTWPGSYGHYALVKQLYRGTPASVAPLARSISVWVQTVLVWVWILLRRGLSLLCSLPQVAEKPVGCGQVKTSWFPTNVLELCGHPAALLYPAESPFSRVLKLSLRTLFKDMTFCWLFKVILCLCGNTTVSYQIFLTFPLALIFAQCIFMPSLYIFRHISICKWHIVR